MASQMLSHGVQKVRMELVGLDCVDYRMAPSSTGQGAQQSATDDSMFGNRKR